MAAAGGARAPRLRGRGALRLRHPPPLPRGAACARARGERREKLRGEARRGRGERARSVNEGKMKG